MRLPRPARQLICEFDVRTDRALDHLRGRRIPDRIFYTASELGDFSLVWVWLAAGRGLRSGPNSAQAAVRVFGVALAESLLVNGMVKSLFKRQRPLCDSARPHRLRQPLTSSFPSGHATSAVCLAIVLSEDDPLWPLYAATAAVVATSRVYVKVHHGSDVVAGAALGAALGLAARQLLPLRI